MGSCALVNLSPIKVESLEVIIGSLAVSYKLTGCVSARREERRGEDRGKKTYSGFSQCFWSFSVIVFYFRSVIVRYMIQFGAVRTHLDSLVSISFEKL